MRILYVAAGIPMPGSIGGSTHVIEVSRGLAALGHEVLVVAGANAEGARSEPWALPGTEGRALVCNVPRRQALALTLLPAILRLCAEFQPAAVIERYYNLAGAGLIAARRRGLPALLEVNAPLYDPPSSRKDQLDRACGRPLRRWARWQARAADAIVTPLATTAGKLARPGTIVELPWGANTDLFDRDRLVPETIAETRAALGLPAAGRVAAFSGSFRPWHGVGSFLAAMRELLPARPDLWALLIGDGPERAGLQTAVQGWGECGQRIVFTGRLPYQDVPRHLAVADLGVAPFEPVRHAALRHFGFYWSPLKIFEYGAMGLPTVCPALPPLDTIVRDRQEGRLYPVGNVAGLASAIAALLDDDAGRRAMGARARTRVAREYSWAAHCRALDALLREIVA